MPLQPLCNYSLVSNALSFEAKALAEKSPGDLSLRQVRLGYARDDKPTDKKLNSYALIGCVANRERVKLFSMSEEQRMIGTGNFAISESDLRTRCAQINKDKYIHNEHNLTSLRDRKRQAVDLAKKAGTTVSRFLAVAMLSSGGLTLGYTGASVSYDLTRQVNSFIVQSDAEIPSALLEYSDNNTVTPTSTVTEPLPFAIIAGTPVTVFEEKPPL